MKIGFDARMITHPGIGRYIKNLLNFMLGSTKYKNIEFILYGDKQILKDFKGVITKSYNVPIYGYQELFFCPLQNDQLEIVHIPHFNIPIKKFKRLVITIHDLIYLKIPESLSCFKGIAAKYLIGNAINKADKIIAVSKNTKQDIIEYFPRAKDKIEVIYEASSPEFRKIEDIAIKTMIKNKYSLPDNFILFVGSLKKHKNIIRLIEAYKILKEQGINHSLVIVGKSCPDSQEILKKIRDNNILYLKDIPTADLIILYNLAFLVVIPSVIEGFGLPALEAMSCGTPVAASNITSLPEVIGDAGVYFDPYNINSICDAMQKIITDEKLKTDLIDKGCKRVSIFSWKTTAEKTLDIYNQLNCK